VQAHDDNESDGAWSQAKPARSAERRGCNNHHLHLKTGCDKSMKMPNQELKQQELKQQELEQQELKNKSSRNARPQEIQEPSKASADLPLEMLQRR
jgi:hypothetical protein